jgi:MoxR-like ATPase
VETTPPASLVARGTLHRLQREIATAAYGFDETVRLLLIGLLCESHVLLEGVPGLAKTYLVRTFAQALDLPFCRIQFTPDMLPSDILGNVTLQPRTQELEYRPGPIFASVILADEINRAPPKVQSALLEAMQERQVTIDGVSHPLPRPFIVIATQNPVEQEGTYPLPEAQLDRFLFRILLGYPDEATEVRMLVSRLGASDEVTGKPVLGLAELDRLRSQLAGIHIAPEVVDYLFQVIRQTRRDDRIQLGASPRSGLHFLRAIRARALLAGRSYATPDDVKALAFPVLNHRLILRPDVLAQQLTTAADSTERSIRALIDSLLGSLHAPR